MITHQTSLPITSIISKPFYLARPGPFSSPNQIKFQIPRKHGKEHFFFPLESPTEHRMSHPITSLISKTWMQIQPLTGLVPYFNEIQIPRKPYDVFINHRGVDTKEKEAGLVYDYLRGSGFNPFLDVQSLKPGDKFPDQIDEAVRGCKVGISIFSPRYGESQFCLDELVLLMETGKPLLPIFCNIEPSELRVAEYRAKRSSAEQVKRFADALEEAKGIVGLRFRSDTGNWSKLGRDTVEAVERIFIKLGEECPRFHTTRGHNNDFAREDVAIP